jgi:hypothetical protein
MTKDLARTIGICSDDVGGLDDAGQQGGTVGYGNAEARPLAGAARRSSGHQPLPVPEGSGHAGTVTATGVEQQPCQGGSVKLTVEVAAGESDVTGRVRYRQAHGG